MSKLLQELQRRNVVRVTAAYLAVAWLVIQLVGEIGPILEAPDWFARSVLGLLALGLPVVVVLSWVYERTNRGIRRTTEVDDDSTLVSTGGHALNLVIIGALLVALGYFIWESRFSARDTVNPAETAQERSIAVLPFADMSASGDQTYFAEGMAEELLNALSRVPELKVAGRTSSFAFAGSTLSAAEIAGQLEVAYLLEGSIRTAGDQLRVTAQLVHAKDGFQVWSDEFEGLLSDIFAVQDHISAQVVSGLKLQLKSESKPRPSEPTSNMLAYDHYLLGRYHMARRTEESLRIAEREFREAIEEDDEFSAAWSGLATVLAVSPWYELSPDSGATAHKARTAAQTALQLDPENSEAWAALGTVQLNFQNNWTDAAAMLIKAVELHPEDATNANLLGDYWYITGNYLSALELEGLAAELEPRSAMHQHELALVYGLLGDLDRALEQEIKAISIDPGFNNAWVSKGRILLDLGRFTELEKLLGDQPAQLDDGSDLALNALLHFRQGQTAEAFDWASQLLAKTRANSGSLVRVAHVFAVLGDDQQAVDLIMEARGNSDPVLISPLYFFLPEDWPGLPGVQKALSAPDLETLFDLRRGHIAAGKGRGAMGYR